MGKMILASSSPRRANILKDYKLEIMPSTYIENHIRTAFSYEYVENLAYNKAKAVANLINEEAIIIGADTVVVLDKEILEKPKDFNDAFSMLKKLSNNTHKVVTAISIIKIPQQIILTRSTTSFVTFNELSDEMITNYINTYQPYDKAGSYGIQELPEEFVKNIDGDFENIVGISSKVFAEMLNELI